MRRNGLDDYDHACQKSTFVRLDTCKFNVDRKTKDVTIIIMLVRMILTTLLDFRTLLILVLFLSFLSLSGIFQEKTYFFTISENLFNLDHNRIKNDIQPRIHNVINSAIR